MAKKSNHLNSKKADLKMYELVYPLDRPWGEAALILEQISRTEHWQKTHSSFTAWVRTLAELSGFQESNIWRMITSARFYVGLGGRYGAITLPPLDEICSLITAEQLELIEKISRVAPRDEIEKLLANAVTGSLTRDRLRLLWRVYRDGDATESKPKNSLKRQMPHGQLPESLIAPDKLSCLNAVRARTLISLLDADPIWTGVQKPHLYRTIYNPPVSISIEKNSLYSPDCLVVLQAERKGDVIFHFVEMFPLKNSTPINIISKSKSVLRYCHFFWLAVDMVPEDFSISGIPENVGIITANGKSLTVHRAPRLSIETGEKSGDLAKLLLAEIL